MSEKSGKKTLQRTLVIASGLAFLALMVFPLADLFSGNSQPSKEIQPSSENSVNNEELKTKEQGYQQVLKREPNNPLALQGLVEARLQMNNFAGAIEPLEKLDKLYPNTPVVLQRLAEARLRTNDLKGALEPLDKLIKLYPNEEAPKKVREQIKQELQKQNPGSK